MSRFASLLSTTLLLLICGCSGKGEMTDLEDYFTVRVAEHVYNIPFEYDPYAGNLIADDLRDLQRAGSGVRSNPYYAQQISFRTTGGERAGVSSLGVQIYDLQESKLAEHRVVQRIDVESVDTVSVTGPIPGDDDPNSVYRDYGLGAEFEFVDGRVKSVPFDCQGGDGFGEVAGETIFGCYLGLVVDEETGLLLRLGPSEDPDLIRKDISFALDCLLSLRQGEQSCQ